MAIVVQFEFPHDLVETYDQVLEAEPEFRDQPLRSYHVCYATIGGFGVVDVWESEEAFAKFGQQLGPVLQRFGMNAEPTRINRVHNIIV
jgi:hypothetical protein